MDYKYTGIILGKRDVGETDRLYTIFTLEAGKIRALAKGVRKAAAKLAGNLENFTLADVSVVKNQGTGKITSSIVENNFTALKANFDALAQVFEGSKIFNQLVQWEQKDERLFCLLKEYLEAMNGSGASEAIRAETISLGFIFKLLEASGYGLEVGGCVVCGNALKVEKENYFSAERGGVVCADCRAGEHGQVRIAPNSVKTIRLFFANRVSSFWKLKINPRELRELQLIVREFLIWIGK